MTHDASGYGLRTLVVLNSAQFLMFAFSVIKPNTARDWRTFGAFAAFIGADPDRRLWITATTVAGVDFAGRVFKSVPAPINLTVPPHLFASDSKLVIGADATT
jgi:hypothetical protein